MLKVLYKFLVCGNWKYIILVEDEEDEDKCFINNIGSVYKMRFVVLFMFGYLCFVMLCLL